MCLEPVLVRLFIMCQVHVYFLQIFFNYEQYSVFKFMFFMQLLYFMFKLFIINLFKNFLAVTYLDINQFFI
jgi:hypothetical protein